jgi:hypothetical protein
MKKCFLTFFLLLMVSMVRAQIPVQYCVIQDWDACTPSGSTPTTSCTASSTFGETPTTNSFSGTTYLTTTSTAAFNSFFGVTPTCASGFTNSTTVGLTLTIPSGSPQNTLTQYFSSGTAGNIGSAAVPWMTDVTQNAAQVGGSQYYDTFDISTNGGFVNFQWLNEFQTNALDWDFECGGCTQNAAPYRLLPSNTWWIVQEFANGSTARYIGMWNGSTGAFIVNGTSTSLATGTSPTAQSIEGYYVGTGVGHGLPVNDHVYMGPVMECGVTARETGCVFPIWPGTQRIYPTISLAGGSYSTPQTVSLSDIDGQGSIYYTLDGSTPSCTLGANDVIGTCHGSLYSGSLSIYITTTLNAIDCRSNFQCSTVSTATYKITAGAGVLAPARSIDWTQVGAVPGQPGIIPDSAWTQSGSTVAACGTSGSPVSPSTCGITSAVSSCGANEYVLLGAGNFYLNAGLPSPPNNCEIRGSGANSTFFHFTGETSCNGTFSEICLAGSNNFPGGEQNHATWTAGFAQGATTLTLSNTLNIVAGQTIIALDQQGSSADTGQIWNNVDSHSGATGSSGAPRTDNTCSSGTSPNYGYCPQVQYVLVTACGTCNSASSSTVTISPGLYAANWASANSTGAWWATTVAQQMGIRDLSIDDTNTTAGTTPIVINNCYECFVYQVRTIYGARNHIGIQYSKNVTVMSNYMFNDSVNGTSSYAIELDDAEDTLVANNICQQVVECVVSTGGGAGNVDFGNFAKYSISTSGALPPMLFNHGAGDMFWLSESDCLDGRTEDNTHGTHAFATSFRPCYPGYEANGAGAPYASQTTPIYIYGGARYMNVIGGVIGQASFHNTLSYFASGTCSNNWTTEFIIGCGASGAVFCANAASCGSGTQAYDTLAENSAVLYDNYDVVSAASHTIQTASSFNDATGSPSNYIGLSSPGTLPPSLVFAGEPSWFQNAGTALPWPAIGPDVSGGNLLLCTSGTYSGSYVDANSKCGSGTSSSAFAGHANMNAAMACYLDTMSGAPDGSGSVLSFNPTACYAGASSPGTTMENLSGATLRGATLQ